MDALYIRMLCIKGLILIKVYYYITDVCILLHRHKISSIQQINWLLFAVACMIVNNRHTLTFSTFVCFISCRWAGRLWWWVHTVAQDWTRQMDQTCLTPPRNLPTTRLTQTMRFPSQTVSSSFHSVWNILILIHPNVWHKTFIFISSVSWINVVNYCISVCAVQCCNLFIVSLYRRRRCWTQTRAAVSLL